MELSFLVDEATAVKVNFARSSLKVSVAGRTIADGETGGDVAVDDSTYTIQDGKDGKKEEELGFKPLESTVGGQALGHGPAGLVSAPS